MLLFQMPFLKEPDFVNKKDIILDIIQDSLVSVHRNFGTEIDCSQVTSRTALFQFRPYM